MVRKAQPPRPEKARAGAALAGAATQPRRSRAGQERRTCPPGDRQADSSSGSYASVADPLYTSQAVSGASGSLLLLAAAGGRGSINSLLQLVEWDVGLLTLQPVRSPPEVGSSLDPGVCVSVRPTRSFASLRLSESSAHPADRLTVRTRACRPPGAATAPRASGRKSTVELFRHPAEGGSLNAPHYRSSASRPVPPARRDTSSGTARATPTGPRRLGRITHSQQARTADVDHGPVS